MCDGHLNLKEQQRLMDDCDHWARRAELAEHKLAVAAHKEALAALQIQNVVTSLASRFDTRLVMRVLRDWLDFMDRQVAAMEQHGMQQSDGPGSAP